MNRNIGLLFVFMLMNGCIFFDSTTPSIENNFVGTNNNTISFNNGTTNNGITHGNNKEAFCGDGILDLDEACDPGEGQIEPSFMAVEAKTCSSELGPNYVGELGCSKTCKLITSGCYIKTNSIEAGWRNTCSLDAKGNAFCWGNNANGQTNIPRNKQFKKLSSNKKSTCGIDTDDHIQCWGGALATDLPKTGSYVDISISTDTVKGNPSVGCAITDAGKIKCWGDETSKAYPTAAVLAGLNAKTLKKVALGPIHGCALKKDKKAVCWGVIDSATPDSEYIQIASGRNHSCGINISKKLVCWGRVEEVFEEGGFKKVGSAKTSIESYSADYKKVAIGAFHICALKKVSLAKVGNVECWMVNKEDGAYADFGQANPPKRDYIDITAGSYHTCGLREDGKVECWGLNRDGQGNKRIYRGEDRHVTAVHARTGIASFSGASPYSKGAPEGAFKKISLGKTFACGTRWNNRATCWGDGAPDLSNATVSKIAVGNGFYCRWNGTIATKSMKCFVPSNNEISTENVGAFDVEGTSACWYDREKEELLCKKFGEDAESAIAPRAHVPPQGFVRNMVVNKSAFCYLGKQNKIHCNTKEMTTITDYDTYPIEEQFRFITAGSNFFCGIKLDDGSIMCWGNDWYNIGKGKASIPKDYYTDIQAGGGVACAISIDNTVPPKCWWKKN